MLGGVYSLLFHENGTADFIVAGTPLPGILWEEVGDGNLQIDYYGTKMYIIRTESGYDMNYFDTMLMHFVSEG